MFSILINKLNIDYLKKMPVVPVRTTSLMFVDVTKTLQMKSKLFE
ncbi:hypothetical protein P278_14700 [Zhouia amylolytica AD3]|uniref:Uncharacterized protein n=1 Tax=Zhouia amylolytica AD3 TaxID=1286632 RepID=W2UR06_9FLAO|nr:hypothetical protein P278_14700 [Zhouia amylolytica AD3]